MGDHCATPVAAASSSGGCRGRSFSVVIAPESDAWRVDVYDQAHRRVATTIENTPYEAAVIGVGMWQRYCERVSVVTCNKGNN